jgi:ribosomal RNA methyltransferase Nop2
MGRKLDPTNQVKKGPGRKSRKQKGAETELSKFITAGKLLQQLTYELL